MKELVSLIESFAYENGKDNKQVLDDLLTYIICYFDPFPKKNPQWTYTKEQNVKFYEMMAEYIRIMDEELKHKEWFDAWGDLFMSLTTKGGAKGQFFTPTQICDMMAKMEIDTDKLPEKSCGGFGNRIAIADPAAGSSRCLLAAHARFIHDQKKPPYLVAEDVDRMCCKMSAVNMMMHGCFGEVVCHDTLADPKGLKIGYIINEGMYPFYPGLPTIRTSQETKDFVSLRPQPFSQQATPKIKRKEQQLELDFG